MASAGTLASILIKLGIDARDVEKTMGAVNKQFGGLQKVGMAAAGFAGGVLGDAAFQGTQAWVQLDDEMRQVFSILPGIGKDAREAMTDEVRQLAIDMNTTTSDISQGLYQALSSGIPKENVFDFMTIASKTARAGAADTASTVTALAAVTNAYRMTTEETQQASDQMFKAVEMGVTTIPELSASLAQVTPLASAAGIGFDEVLASITAMTLQGTPTAEAITQIRSSIVALMKPNTSMLKGLRAFGYESGQAAIDALGYQGAMELVKQISDETGTSLPKLTGRIEGTNAVLQLTGQNADAAHAALNGINDSAGRVDAAFAEMEGGVGGTVRKVQAMIRDMALGVGQFLEPIAPIMMAFGPQMGRWIGRGMGAAFGVAATIAAPLVSKAFKPLAKIAADAFNSAFSALQSGAEGLFSKIGGSGLAEKWGKITGGKFGKMFVVGALLAVALLWVEVINQFFEMMKTIENAQKANMDKALAESKKSGAEAIKDMTGFAKKLHDVQGIERMVGDTFGGKEWMEAFRNQMKAILSDTTLTGEQIKQAMTAMEAARVEAIARGNQQVADELAAGIEALKARAIPAATQAGAGIGHAAAKAMGPAMTQAMPTETAAQTARIAGYRVGSRWANGITDAIRGNLTKVQDAASAIGEAMAKGPKLVSYKKRMEQFRKATEHVLKMMKRAVAANDPAGAAYWVQQYEKIKTQQSEFRGSTQTVWGDVAAVIDENTNSAKGDLGRLATTVENKALAAQLSMQKHAKKAGAAFPDELIVSTAKAGTAAQGMATTVEAPIITTTANMTTYGQHAGQNFAQGLSSQYDEVNAAARHLAGAASGPLAFSAPPREGPLSTIRQWGPHMIAQWTAGTESALSRVRRTAGKMAGAMVPRTPQMAHAGVGYQSVRPSWSGASWSSGGARGGTSEVHLHIGTLVADDRGLDELERRMSNRKRLRGRGHPHYNDVG